MIESQTWNYNHKSQNALRWAVRPTLGIIDLRVNISAIFRRFFSKTVIKNAFTLLLRWVTLALIKTFAKCPQIEIFV